MLYCYVFCVLEFLFYILPIRTLGFVRVMRLQRRQWCKSSASTERMVLEEEESRAAIRWRNQCSVDATDDQLISFI